jgi:hypothetical protein
VPLKNVKVASMTNNDTMSAPSDLIVDEVASILHHELECVSLGSIATRCQVSRYQASLALQQILKRPDPLEYTATYLETSSQRLAGRSQRNEDSVPCTGKPYVM